MKLPEEAGELKTCFHWQVLSSAASERRPCLRVCQGVKETRRHRRLLTHLENFLLVPFNREQVGILMKYMQTKEHFRKYVCRVSHLTLMTRFEHI